MALVKKMGNEVNNDFGIGITFKYRATGFKFCAQRVEVLDDAIVYDGHTAVAVRVCVLFVGDAVGGPAGVADPEGARQRRRREALFEVDDLPSARLRWIWPWSTVATPAES
jgi:hypothetical protein